MIEDGVNAACDGLDGIKDGVLDDPRKCTFDPQTLVCKPGQDACVLSDREAGQSGQRHLDAARARRPAKRCIPRTCAVRRRRKADGTPT